VVGALILIWYQFFSYPTKPSEVAKGLMKGWTSYSAYGMRYISDEVIRKEGEDAVRSSFKRSARDERTDRLSGGLKETVVVSSETRGETAYVILENRFARGNSARKLMILAKEKGRWKVRRMVDCWRGNCPNY
jgi:hypothetical protein